MTVGPDLQHERRARLRRPRRTEGGRRELDVIMPIMCTDDLCVGERRGRGKSHKFQSGMHSPGDRTLPLGAEANKYLMFNRRVKRERDRHQHAAASLRAHVSSNFGGRQRVGSGTECGLFFFLLPSLLLRITYLDVGSGRDRACRP